MYFIENLILHTLTKFEANTMKFVQTIMLINEKYCCSKKFTTFYSCTKAVPMNVFENTNTIYACCNSSKPY